MTAHDLSAFFAQPLDRSCRDQSLRRGFALSLPILIIYLSLNLLNFVPGESKLGKQYKGTVTRFWSYRREEGFRDYASLCTYVTSQFTHTGVVRLMVDSVVLVGVASLLSSTFNRRTFFGVYVLGGFLAAALDCAWARMINPSRSLTPAEQYEVSKYARLALEAHVKLTELVVAAIVKDGFKAIGSMLGMEKYQGETTEQITKQAELFVKYVQHIRNHDIWTRANWAASGSLVCLLSIATFLRPRTVVCFVGVRPSVSLYKITWGIVVFNLYMPLATLSNRNHTDCLGGNLAAVRLWFLWLRRGRIGVLSSALRAFDKANKHKSWLFGNWRTLSFGAVAGLGIVELIWREHKKQEAQQAEKAVITEPPQHASETGKPLAEGPKEDAADDSNAQEGASIEQPAAVNDDNVSENDKE